MFICVNYLDNRDKFKRNIKLCLNLLLHSSSEHNVHSQMNSIFITRHFFTENGTRSSFYYYYFSYVFMSAAWLHDHIYRSEGWFGHRQVKPLTLTGSYTSSYSVVHTKK